MKQQAARGPLLQVRNCIIKNTHNNRITSNKTSPLIYGLNRELSEMVAQYYANQNAG